MDKLLALPFLWSYCDINSVGSLIFFWSCLIYSFLNFSFLVLVRSNVLIFSFRYLLSSILIIFLVSLYFLKEGKKGNHAKTDRKKIRERKGKEKRVKKLWKTLSFLSLCVVGQRTTLRFWAQKAENLVFKLPQKPIFTVVWHQKDKKTRLTQNNNNFCTCKHNWPCSKCTEVLPPFFGGCFFLGWCLLL